MAVVFPAAHIRLLITLGLFALFFYTCTEATARGQQTCSAAARAQRISAELQMSHNVRALSAGQPIRSREQERPTNGPNKCIFKPGA